MDRDVVTCICPRCAGSLKDPEDLAGGACLLCKGRGIVPDCQLTAHFRYSELVHPSRHGRNDPPVEVLDRLTRLCRELLEPVRATPLPDARCEAMDLPAGTPVGALLVTSGYRTQQLDVIADAGNPKWLTQYSGHSWGAAADVVPTRPGLTIVDVVEAARRLPMWDQVILEAGCAHLALLCPTTNAQRRQVMVRVRGAAGFAYETYRPDDPAQHAACV